MTVRWTKEAIEALGPTTNVPTVAEIFEVDRETVYGQIRRQEWTLTRVLRLGRKIRIPTRDLIAVLYPSEATAAPIPHEVPSVPSACHHDANRQVTAVQPHASCGCPPVSDAPRPRLESERSDAPRLRPPSRPGR